MVVVDVGDAAGGNKDGRAAGDGNGEEQRLRAAAASTARCGRSADRWSGRGRGSGGRDGGSGCRRRRRGRGRGCRRVRARDAAIYDQLRAIERPVGRLVVVVFAKDGVALAGGHIEDLQRRLAHARSGDDIGGQRHLGEHRGLAVGIIVRGDGEAGIRFGAEHDGERTEILPRATGTTNGGVDDVRRIGSGDGVGGAGAVALEADGDGGLDRGRHFLRRAAGRLAKLKTDVPVAMHHDVGVGRIGREALAEHDAGLATRGRAGAGPRDVRLQVDIARDFFVAVVKRIGRAPDIGAAAGERVGVGGRIEFRGTRVGHSADVSMAVEQAEGGGRAVSGGGDRSEKEKRAGQAAAHTGGEGFHNKTSLGDGQRFYLERIAAN